MVVVKVFSGFVVYAELLIVPLGVFVSTGMTARPTANTRKAAVNEYGKETLAFKRLRDSPPSFCREKAFTLNKTFVVCVGVKST